MNKNLNSLETLYEVLDYGNIKNLEHFRSVTTMADECKPVGQNLSLSEAHSIVKK